jgi:C-terminal processing protease CtpA/Prc
VRLCVAAIALAVLTTLPCSKWQTTQAQEKKLRGLELERVREMLHGVKSELKKNYYDPAYRGMDIEARFKTAEEKLAQADSLGHGIGVIAQLLVELNDSHTYFIPPQRTTRVDYGWQMKMVGDKCFVVAIKPGTDAEAKGLKVGDQVIAVDNVELTRDNLWKMRYMYYTLRPRPGMQLAVQSPGAPEREVIVMAKVQTGKRIMDLTNGNDIWDLLRDSEAEDRLDRQRYYDKHPDVLIWKMPTFAVPETEMDVMMSKARKRKNLILDLRGNGGGYVVTLQRLVGHFFDREIKIGDLKGRKEMKPQLAKPRGGKPYDGKIVVLIDHESGSAAELFARVMQIEKRGTVIGDTSAGAVMQSRVFGRQLGADTVSFYAVSVTNADVVMTDGKSLEHTGVTPDETVLPTGSDLAAKRDPVLARAAALVGLELPAQHAGMLFPIEWRK